MLRHVKQQNLLSLQVMLPPKSRDSHESCQLIPSLSSERPKDEGFRRGYSAIALDALGQAAGILPDFIDLVSDAHEFQQPSGLQKSSCIEREHYVSSKDLLSSERMVSMKPQELGPLLQVHSFLMPKAIAKKPVGGAAEVGSGSKPKLTGQSGDVDKQKVRSYLT